MSKSKQAKVFTREDMKELLMAMHYAVNRLYDAGADRDQLASLPNAALRALQGAESDDVSFIWSKLANRMYDEVMAGY